jgi:hypothetical protein
MGGRRWRKAAPPNVNAYLPSHMSVTSQTTITALGASNKKNVFLKLNEQTQ